MALLESGEMYLETILVLASRGKTVRAIDISEYMGFSKPSVSRALSRLRAEGYVTVSETGAIAFTETGRTVAEKIYARHTLLSELLEQIGVDPDTAREDACRIEHDISDETFAALKRYVRSHE